MIVRLFLFSAPNLAQGWVSLRPANGAAHFVLNSDNLTESGCICQIFGVIKSQSAKRQEDEDAHQAILPLAKFHSSITRPTTSFPPALEIHY